MKPKIPIKIKSENQSRRDGIMKGVLVTIMLNVIYQLLALIDPNVKTYAIEATTTQRSEK